MISLRCIVFKSSTDPSKARINFRKGKNHETVWARVPLSSVQVPPGFTEIFGVPGLVMVEKLEDDLVPIRLPSGEMYTVDKQDLA